jgi:hypothetical protein
MIIVGEVVSHYRKGPKFGTEFASAASFNRERSTEPKTFGIYLVQETKYFNHLHLFDKDIRSYLIIKLSTLLTKVYSTN